MPLAAHRTRNFLILTLLRHDCAVGPSRWRAEAEMYGRKPAALSHLLERLYTPGQSPLEGCQRQTV